MLELTRTLLTTLRQAAPPMLCVAFSGGPDSTALLHALAQWPEARALGLRALHVDHHLHPDSAAWAQHCREFCAALDIPLVAVPVAVRDAHGEGVEAAARRTRYAAFAAHLHDGEWLTTAHHRDDQIETVLLKWLRGAGPEGLAGMRAERPFAHGVLWRPLLETSREVLRNYLMLQGIKSIDDPANHNRSFARNAVREELVPALTHHSPHALASILHSARLCLQTADFIAATADATLVALRRADDTLDAAGWLALPTALRAATLDHWLHARGLPVPPDHARAELERQVAYAADDRVPRITWPGTEVRVWDQRLHALPPLVDAPAAWHAAWDGAELSLPGGGSLALDSAAADASAANDAARFNPPLTVRLRAGGERIKPAGDAHTRELRDLFQSARISPWLRDRCPLIYSQDELIAVADLWTNARGAAAFDRVGARPRWQRPGWAPTTTPTHATGSVSAAHTRHGRAEESLFDLDAYLARIGVAQPPAPNVDGLRTLIAAHVAAIPFENLDPLLGVPVMIDSASVQRKLVLQHRGGYCFEHNRLLGDALHALGYHITDLAARVLWGQPDDAITARSHMLLCVEIERTRWLADVGFGGKTPSAPLRLQANIEQATPHEAFRLLRHGEDDWRMQVQAQDGWRTLYRFDLQPQWPADYRVSNYWTSTHPDSHFVTGLTTARAAPGRRLSLRNREFTVTPTGGEPQRCTLKDAAAIRAVLEREFLIRLPAHSRIERTLDALP